MSAIMKGLGETRFHLIYYPPFPYRGVIPFFFQLIPHNKPVLQNRSVQALQATVEKPFRGDRLSYITKIKMYSGASIMQLNQAANWFTRPRFLGRRVGLKKVPTI